MKNHMVWMVIGCVVPMLLIFILPAFGVGNQVVFVIFIVLMFACHFMMLGHQYGEGDQDEELHCIGVDPKTR